MREQAREIPSDGLVASSAYRHLDLSLALLENFESIDIEDDAPSLSLGLPYPPAVRLVLASLRTQADELRRAATVMSNAVELAIGSAPQFSTIIGDVAARTIPRWHFAMLNDNERNDAFAVALERCLPPDAHVLDIGSGTGLLAMMAARAGARKVTTCEVNPLLAEIATQVVAAHGMSDVITVVPKRSDQLQVGVDIERPADLIISEIVDCGLIGEGLFATMRHARKHLLAPGGRLLPESARLFGFLVESKVMARLNGVGSAHGFNLRLLNTVATQGHFPVRLRTWPHRVLSETTELAKFDLANDTLDDGSRKISLPVAATGEAHALVVWFELNLGGNVMVRSSPDNLSSHWMQAFVPFRRPLPLVAGDTLDFELQWQGEHLSVVENFCRSQQR